MDVVVGLRSMTGVVVIMSAMVTRVFMVMHKRRSAMGMLMEMLVPVLMSMAVRMLVAVCLAVVGMLV